MLVALDIRNFVLIDHLELKLEPGLNVLTGETGAGKSIVVGALGLLFGGRARADVIRPGAAQAEIEALFDVSHNDAVTRRLLEADVEAGGELVIRRVLCRGDGAAAGRSRAYLNGRLCTARQLAELATELCDITSQHESVALADPARHLLHLDHYAGLDERRRAVGELYDELCRLDAAIAELRDRERGRAEREGFLRYQLDAIDQIGPRPDEHAELGRELSRRSHAERLREVTGSAAARLDDDGGLCDELARMASRLASVAELDPELGAAAEQVEATWAALREVARTLASYSESVDSGSGDGARLEEVQARLYRLETLMRQHGPTLEDVLQTRSRIEAELEELGAAEVRLPELCAAREAWLARAAAEARELSRSRVAAACSLSQAITAELGALGMGSARVEVEVSRRGAASPGPGRGPAASSLAVDDAQLGRDGIDRVEFLIAPNKGMEPRPLRRIASGGELSRALLALKRALHGGSGGASSGSRATLQVFDEVDTGVGGATADRIGRAIAAIAGDCQVLCITHLAAIAAYGDAHFVVSKSSEGEHTTSDIERVDGQQRVAAIARMLTGNEGGSSRRAARELLSAAAEAKLGAPSPGQGSEAPESLPIAG